MSLGATLAVSPLPRVGMSTALSFFFFCTLKAIQTDTRTLYDPPGIILSESRGPRFFFC